MGILSIAAQLLLSLSLLVLLHEFGHFAAARIFKTKVEKFYLFFDFLFPFPNLAKWSIFKIKRGDTEYGLGWFPMGGYVKIAGMLDESADKEALKQPPQPWEFRSKPAWQRLIIILGGIIVNLILGVLILWMVKFTWGDTYVPLSKTEIAVNDSTLLSYGLRTGDRILGYENSGELTMDIILNGVRTFNVERNGETTSVQVGEDFVKIVINNPKAAYFQPRMPFIIEHVDKTAINYGVLQKGDRLIQLDTVPIAYYDQVSPLAATYKGDTIPARVERDGVETDLRIRISDEGLLEVRALGDYRELNKKGFMPLEVKRYGLFKALPAAINQAGETIVNYVKQFKLIFNPSTGAYKQVSGVAGIAKMFDPAWNWEHFWRMTAVLSLVLAFMNFLPIPMLDGGYMVFILYEMITGRKPGEKFMEVASTVGFVIVMLLLVFANGNDILKWILGK